MFKELTLEKLGSPVPVTLNKKRYVVFIRDFSSPALTHADTDAHTHTF